jgi:hypothetical protein
MKFGVYSAFFLFSMIKFLFTPFGGPKAHLTFFETYFSCVAGAVLSATIFYFLSELLMVSTRKKNEKLRREALASGIELPFKKKFTKTNKFVVRMKMRFGIFGIAMYAPFFLSVPLGTIITAKFYGKEKKTFPIILFGIFVNGLLTTGIAYIIADFF